MNLQRKVYASQGEKAVDFFIGFAGFFVGNGILWGILSVVNGLVTTLTTQTDFETANNILVVVSLVLSCSVFVINIAALTISGLTRYWIALGLLGAFTSIILLVLCAAVVVGTLCFGAAYSYS